MTSNQTKRYRKYIASTRVYRVTSSEYLSRIKKHGIEPGRDPFTKQRAEIITFLKLCLKLKRRGFIMWRQWSKPVDQTVVVKTTLKDIRSGYVDFAPKSKVTYYRSLRGGALVNTVRIYAREIIKRKPALNDAQSQLVRKMRAWSDKRYAYRNAVISIRGNSSALENAKFQIPGKHLMLPSPFGSPAHFEKVVAKHGWSAYADCLNGKCLFYIRVKKPIAASAIRF